MLTDEAGVPQSPRAASSALPRPRTPGDVTVLGMRIIRRFFRKVVNRPGDCRPDLDHTLIPLHLYLRVTLRH